MEQKSDNLQVFQDQSKLTFKKRKSIRKRRRTFNIRNTLKPKKNLKVIQYGKIIDEKLCQNCKNNDHDDKFIFCDQCDDAYHKFCLDPPLINLPQGIWLCPKCQILQNEMKNDKLKNQQSQEPQNCSKCSQPLKNHKILKYQNQKGIQMQQTIPSQKVKCLYCKNWFHDSCMSKRLNSLNCYSCEIFLRRSCPKNHLQFVNFIKKQNQLVIKSGYLKLYDQSISQQQEDPQKSKKKQRKQVNYTFNLKDFDEPTHWQSITRYEASLYYALKTKKLVFCNQQLYKTQSLLAKNNQQKQILKIKPLNQSDTRTYQFFKWKISKGAVGPYQIKQDRIKGFYVQATAPIQKGTIICQYAGEVCSHRESLKQVKNDSIFTLLTSGSSEDDLNIIPNKFGNMSRFICGINNNDRQQMRLINLKAIRFSYKGRIRILFCAKKYIQKGETLYLNYNDGTFQEYPTENFVA